MGVKITKRNGFFVVLKPKLKVYKSLALLIQIRWIPFSLWLT